MAWWEDLITCGNNYLNMARVEIGCKVRVTISPLHVLNTLFSLSLFIPSYYLHDFYPDCFRYMRLSAIFHFHFISIRHVFALLYSYMLHPCFLHMYYMLLPCYLHEDIGI